MKKENTKGCLSSCTGCLGAGVILFVLIGVSLYFLAPVLLKDIDKKFLPWLEDKALIIAGEIALTPLTQTIDRSELTNQEKRDWKDFLAEKYAEAGLIEGKILQRREALFDASHAVVGSYAGLYYGMLSIDKQYFRESTLSRKQVAIGKNLIAIVTTNMVKGVYTLEELKPLSHDLYFILTGWHFTQKNSRGKTERNNHFRDLFRSISKLNKKKAHAGDGQTIDMDKAFRASLASLKERLNVKEERPKMNN